MDTRPRYLQRHEIDLSKWDNCISQSENGLIYGYSWWLDAMADHWDGLILNDYEVVMPITWKQKYTIKYLYQPRFTSSLGMFKKPNVSASLEDFLSLIPKKFRYWDFDLNEDNAIRTVAGLQLKMRERTNLIIKADDYTQVRGEYSRLARRSLAKAIHHEVIVTEADIEAVITTYQKHYSKLHPAIVDKDYQNLIVAGKQAFKKGLASGYTASLEGKIIGFYMVLHDSKFYYSLLGGTTDTGKELGAFYALTDHIIKLAMDDNRSFRFEGSDIPGVAFFNRQFGPQYLQYLHVLRNNLPFPLNILK